MPAKKTHKKSGESAYYGRRGVRAFWSGTISFGLVSVPVHLFPANRRGGFSLRLLDQDGTPLSRRYYCPEHGRDVHPEHIVRGFEIEDGSYVVVRDDELEAIEPKKTREIDLRRFVELSQVPPMFFERAYFLTPSGDSNKAYRLLAEVMERTGRAGIATFVMRGKEYLVAILAENGILRTETLRFQDEIRNPENVGLPEPQKPDKEQRSKFERAIRRSTAEKLAPEELQDEYTERTRTLVENKRKRRANIVETEDYEPEEDADEASPIDLLETIRRSLRGERSAPSGNGRRHPVKDDREGRSKEELYERAKELGIAGRSNMTKRELIRAIRDK